MQVLHYKTINCNAPDIEVNVFHARFYDYKGNFMVYRNFSSLKVYTYLSTVITPEIRTQNTGLGI